MQYEVARRRRATAAVDGVEVLRPGEPIAALHCARLRRRAACAHRAPPLENRAAAAGGHPRSEPVTPLPAANVRLIGAFHVVCARSGCGEREYRRTASAECFPQSSSAGRIGNRCSWESVVFSSSNVTTRLPHLWKAVWNNVNPCKTAIFSSTGAAPATLRRGWMALCSPLPDDPREPRGRVEHPAETRADDLWNAIAGRLRDSLTDSTYDTWFGQARPHSFGADRLVVESERLHAELDRGPFSRSRDACHHRSRGEGRLRFVRGR